MAKADDTVKELQRRIRNLERLGGSLVRTAEGPVLLDIAAVRDPFAAIDLGRAGPPTLTDLVAVLELRGEPQRVTGAFLARAHRDLKALALIDWLAVVRAAPRLFRSHGPFDDGWCAAREARLATLAAALRPDAASIRDWTAELVAAVHGPAAADALAGWIDRSVALGPRRRRDARRRVEALVRRLDPDAARPEPSALAVTLDTAARAVARLARPGRAADRRLDLVLRDLLAWPAAAPGRPEPPVPTDSQAPPAPTSTHQGPRPVPSDNPPISRPADRPVPPDSPPSAVHGRSPRPAPPDSHPAHRPQPVPQDSPSAPALSDSPADLPRTAAARAALADRLRARAEPLIRALAGARTPAHVAALQRTLGAYALAFAPDPAAPPPPLDPEALELAATRLRESVDAGLPAGLDLPRALWLLRLPLGPDVRAAVTPWVAAGLPPALLERVIAHDQQARLAGLRGDVALATAYADWLVRLVPHYKRLGIALALEPAHFARLHATHRGGLALLAHCLVEHHAPGERDPEAQLARLRATLGLFAARPQRAEALLADLSHAPAGLGRRTFPGFAAWLGETSTLDRFCHLCALADEPVALSHTLRRDLERIPRVRRQRDWLAAREDRTPEQDARLATLDAEIAASELVDPAWTLRRLADRCEALQARAFARRLDEILRDVLADAIGQTPPPLTPAWRDAVRFWLGAAERNRGLLTHLLRFAAAAPGRPIAATLPSGQAWIARARARIDPDAWLAPRRRVRELDGQRHTIALEDDPLEVLRMGIPFDTCLSLADGFNADSTVLNAVDPNKRVLYVRDARGAVVARKLLAVSADLGLLGYRLYSDRRVPGLHEAVAEFCRELAADCRLPLADSGAPETIHPGFWYDDGVAPWTGPGRSDLASLADYFTRIGRPAPRALGDWTVRNLHAWDACARRDVPLARSLLDRIHHGPVLGPLTDLIADALGPRDLARAARRDQRHAEVHLRRSARAGVPALLQAAAAFGKFPHALTGVADAVDHAPSSPAVARAWLAAIARTRRAAPHFDDHGLEHRSFQIDRHLARLPPAELLAACAELDETWSWIVAQSPTCDGCRASGQWGLEIAAEAAYARAPDPAAVLSALAGRRGRLAQSVALHLAARFSLAQRPCPLEHGLGATWLTRLTQRPLPAPQAVVALRALQRARPDLAATVDMFAALVRQSGPDAAPTHLPTPDDPPFAALNEFLLHLRDPAALLAPWLDPRVDPAAFTPGRWTCHVHRRGPTPLRRRLARLVAHGSDPAREWLALLADTAALDFPGGGRTHRAIARDIAHQLTLLAPAPPESPVPPVSSDQPVPSDSPTSAAPPASPTSPAPSASPGSPAPSASFTDHAGASTQPTRTPPAPSTSLRGPAAATLPAKTPPAPSASPRDRGSPRAAPGEPDAVLLARFTAAATPDRELRARDPRAIDLVLLREAVRVLALAARRPVPPATVTLALDQLDASGLDRHAWHDVVATLLPGDGPPAPAVLPALAAVLARDDLRGLDRDLAARLSAAPELRAALLARLLDDARSYHCAIHPTISRMQRAACPDPAARDALLVDLVAAAGRLGIDVDTPMNTADQGRFHACLPIWTARPAPEWLALYRDLHELHLQSLLLDARLAATPDPTERAALRDLALAEWDPPDDNDEDTAARTWLLAALE